MLTKSIRNVLCKKCSFMLYQIIMHTAHVVVEIIKKCIGKQKDLTEVQKYNSTSCSIKAQSKFQKKFAVTTEMSSDSWPTATRQGKGATKVCVEKYQDNYLQLNKLWHPLSTSKQFFEEAGMQAAPRASRCRILKSVAKAICRTFARH